MVSVRARLGYGYCYGQVGLWLVLWSGWVMVSVRARLGYG